MAANRFTFGTQGFLDRDQAGFRFYRRDRKVDFELNERVVGPTEQGTGPVAIKSGNEIMNETTGSGLKCIVLLIAILSLAACGGVTDSGGGASTFSAGVVFKADRDTDGTEELYAANADGSRVIRLSNSLATNFTITSWQVSANRRYVAYLLREQQQFPVSELYVVSVDGGTPIRVSSDLPFAGSVSTYAWSPDSARIAYRADQDTQGNIELYTVLSNGDENVKVSGDGQTNIQTDFNWSPDSTHIAYRTGFGTKLYTVRADGLSNVEVSGSLVLNGFVYEDYRWSPDSSRIAYRADQIIDGVVELYISQADGSSNVQVSSVNSDFSSNAELIDFKWSPDGTRIAYVSNDNVWTRDELYVALSNGSNSNRVSGVVVNTSGVDVKSSFKWSPDSLSLAYLADLEIDDVYNLYTVQANGSNNIKISTALKAPQGIFVWGGSISQFVWAPDNSRLAYVALTKLEIINVYRLYSVFPDGTDHREISGTMPLNGGVATAKWSPDSSRLAYVARQEAYDVNGYILPGELYTVRSDGTDNVKVSGTMPTNPNIYTLTGNVTDYLWYSDSQRLLYRADQDIDEQFELYTGQADGSGFMKISGPLIAEGDVLNHVLVQ